MIKSAGCIVNRFCGGKDTKKDASVDASRSKTNNVIKYNDMKNVSGKRGSNPPPTAWKAVALPNELLPQRF